MAERLLIQLQTTNVGDSATAFDVPEDGEIVGIDWDFTASDMDTVGDRGEAQISFLATNQLTTTDARGMISNISLKANATEGTATDPAVASAQKYVNMNDPGLSVSGGERVHLHTVASTGVSILVRCIIHIAVRRATRRARRRR